MTNPTICEEDPSAHPRCTDCARLYGDEYGFPDLVLPNDIWAKISPTRDENGLLCPSCICKRLHDQGIQCSARFRSGPLAFHGVEWEMRRQNVEVMESTMNPYMGIIHIRLVPGAVIASLREIQLHQRVRITVEEVLR